MNKIKIEGIDYEFIGEQFRKTLGRNMVSTHRNGHYHRMYKSQRLRMVENKRHIPRGYIIHHIDKDHTNDVIDNLMLVTRGEHNKLHADDVNHYMFREGHSYWNRPKSKEHKERIKQSHIDRANRKKSMLRDMVFEYVLENKDCTPKDVIKHSGGTQAGHFHRRFGIKFLDFKNKILNGERKRGN